MDSISSKLIVEVSLMVVSFGVIVMSLLALRPMREERKSKIDVDAAVRNAPYHLLEEAGIRVAPPSS